MIGGSDLKVPSPRQMLDMVNIDDKEAVITKEILKSILQIDLKEYDEKNFIEPRFNGWLLSNRLKNGTVDIIDETRGLENISDFDKAIEAANRIKAIVDEMSSTNFIDEDDLGSDFDEPENHVQDSAKYKVKCGFETIDHMLGGGWDVGTLNILMGMSNAGKCCIGDTIIEVKDKKGEITKVDMLSLFSDVRNGHLTAR
jgi:hypothetical protein